MISTGLDQPIKPTPEDLLLFDDVDAIIGRSITVGDPLIALDFGLGLVRNMQTSGIALAKLFYRLKENWNLFEVAGIDTSLEDLVDLHLGRSPESVRKYINMWESVFENPNIADDVKERLKGRPVGDLLLLTAVAKEGEDLSEIADAPDTNSLRRMVRELRGEQTSSKNAIFLKLVVDDNSPHPVGSLFAVHQGVKYELGWLDVDSDNEVVQKAIARMVNRLNIEES